MSKNKTQLEKLLESELVCFKEILYKTQQVDNKGNSQSTVSLMELLDYRDNQIGLIKKLETERKTLEGYNISNNQETKGDSIKKEIKAIAIELVGIDAKLVDLIAMKKENIVKELCVHTDNIGRDRSIQTSRKKLIDITLD